jgi:hypothetical protein
MGCLPTPKISLMTLPKSGSIAGFSVTVGEFSTKSGKLHSLYTTAKSKKRKAVTIIKIRESNATATPHLRQVSQPFASRAPLH